MFEPTTPCGQARKHTKTLSRSATSALVLSTSVFACATFSISALAQSEQGSLAIEEVIVTAQKREESLQEIPVSIRAIGQHELEQLGVVSFEDYARGQAGLSFNAGGRSSRGADIPVIRGVAQLNPQGPTTAFYLDETPLQPQETERVGMPDPNMFDINRVEILRGPQGDLYGSSAMGGTIRVIPNKPDPEVFEGRVDFGMDSVDGGGVGGSVNAMVNIPVSETAALRLVGTYDDEPGWIDLVPEPSLGTTAESDVNDVSARQVRAALRWEATDNLVITPSVFWQDVEEDRSRYVAYEQSAAAGKPIDVNAGVPEDSENSFSVGNLLIEYEMANGSFTSSSTIYSLDWEANLIATGIVHLVVGPPLESTVLYDEGSEDQLIQEFRYTSSLDGPFNFIVGAFYREIEHEFFQEAYSDRFMDVFGTDVIFYKEGETEKLDELALYGQGTWQFNEQWEASVGLRWFDYKRDRYTPTTSGIFGFPERRDNITEDGVSPTFSLRYFANDNAMLYGRVANGFRPGFGFATIFPPPCAPELAELGIDPDSGVGTVDSDDLWSYEFGAKTSWADDRVVVNASVYHQDWTDLQTAISLDCGFVLSANAGKATIDGIEIETQARATENLTLSLNVGYTDAKLAEDATEIGGFDGDRLPGVSEWTIGASAEYDFAISGLPSSLRLNYSYSSDYYQSFSEADKSPINRQPDLSLLGLRFGMEYESWNFALYVKNLTDEFKLGMCAPEAAFRVPQPNYTTCATRPRTIGFNVSKYFD